MPLPVVLVDSAAGSDTAASGAGPSTALSGTTNASTSGDGLTVTLPAATDLSGVATDGSHVIFLNDSTAGARNFGKITGSAGSGGVTPTVTVANAFGLSLTNKSWAIGGKRASVGGTTSIKLFSNNSAAGDAMPGWAVELQSGHAESISTALDVRRAGDATGGAVTLRGASGAATRPVLTFSGDTNGVVCRGQFQTVRDLEVASSVAKTGGNSAITTSAGGARVINVKIVTSGTNKWVHGFSDLSIGSDLVSECEIANVASAGVYCAGGNMGAVKVTGCYIHDCGDIGVRLDGGSYFGVSITDNVFYNNAGDNVQLNNGRTDDLAAATYIARNTFYGKGGGGGGDGVEVANWNESNRNLIVENNVFEQCLYGLKFSHASATAAGLDGYGVTVRNNCFHSNTSGKYLPTDLTSVDESTADPAFTNAAGGDFSIGTNLKALGFPSRNVGVGSSTRSYVDVGAAQRQEPAGGGGGLLTHPGTAGGMRA